MPTEQSSSVEAVSRPARRPHLLVVADSRGSAPSSLKRTRIARQVDDLEAPLIVHRDPRPNRRGHYPVYDQSGASFDRPHSCAKNRLSLRVHHTSAHGLRISSIFPRLC